MTEAFLEQPLFTIQESLEGLNPDQLVDLIMQHGETISKYERIMNLASDVLEGAYGLNVDDVLNKREKENGKT